MGYFKRGLGSVTDGEEMVLRRETIDAAVSAMRSRVAFFEAIGRDPAETLLITRLAGHIREKLKDVIFGGMPLTVQESINVAKAVVGMAPGTITNFEDYCLLINVITNPKIDGMSKEER